MICRQGSGMADLPDTLDHDDHLNAGKRQELLRPFNEEGSIKATLGNSAEAMIYIKILRGSSKQIF